MTNSGFDKPGSLMRFVQVKLKLRQEPLRDISSQTGLPVHWLQMFSAGRILNPSVNRVEYLYRYLVGEALQLPACGADA